MEVLLLPFIGIVGLYVINNRDEKKQNNNHSQSPSLQSPPLQSPSLQSPPAPQQPYQTQYQKSYQMNNNQEAFSMTNAPYSKSCNVNTHHDGILDYQIGTGSQYVAKSEHSPLFASSDSVKWQNGTPSSSDFMQSRMHAIKSTKMTNVVPFKSTKVGPGYYDDNETREKWRDKTVNELRTKNNAKSSEFGLYGYEGPAKHTVTYQGDIGKVEKHRPDTFFENDTSNMIPGIGSIKKETSRPITVDRPTNRNNTSTEYFGSMGSNINGTTQTGYYEPSKKMELNSLPLMPVSATGKQNVFENDYGRYSINSHQEKKLYGKNENYFGAVTGTVKHFITPILDILRPTRKDYMIDNMKSYPRIQPAIANSYVYDPRDAPPTTNRESMENSLFHLQVNAPKSGAYEVQNITNPNTIRSETSAQYSGGANSNSVAHPRLYDGEYATGTLTHRQDSISDWVASGSMKMGYNNSTTETRFRNENLIHHDSSNRPQIQAVANQPLDRANIGQIRESRKIVAPNSDNSYLLDQLADNPFNLQRR